MSRAAVATVRVTVRFFAQLRLASGAREAVVEVVPGTDVRGLAAQLEQRHEGLSLAGVMCAIDERYADPDTPLRGGETVAFLPPVSGG